MHSNTPPDPNVISIVRTPQEEQITLADLIIEYLTAIGTRHVFGVPGGAIEPLYNALARASRMEPVPVRAVVSRHESGAAFMADGYYRETGKLGVCCTTTGPGTTNIITGLSSAYADHIPMLVITAQSAMRNHGRLSLQESSTDGINTVAMLNHCTRYSTYVTHPDQLERKLFKAIQIAMSKPHGPVHLSIPYDVLNTTWSGRSSFNIRNMMRRDDTFDEHGVHKLIKLICRTQNIVLFIGIGCRGSIDSIMEFVEKYNIPFVTSPSGKSLVSSYHPLNRGVFGFASHESARISLIDSDLIIAAGTKLGETSTSGWDPEALMNHKLVHIDESEEDLANSPMAQLQIKGNIRSVFKKLASSPERINVTSNEPDNNPVDIDIKAGTGYQYYQGYAPPQLIITNGKSYKASSSPIKPQRLMHELKNFFPDNTRFISDAGNSWSWTTHYLHLKSVGRYHIGMGLGAMTWGIGAAIGVALGAPGEPVVCITGDGSYLMSGQELTVAVQLKLPVVFVILNDRALGMVKHGQRMGHGEAIGYELPEIDYAAVARAMGAQAFTINSHRDFESIDVNAIIDHEGPTLLDVMLDPEEPPPMGSRMKVLDRRQGGRRKRSGRRTSETTREASISSVHARPFDIARDKSAQAATSKINQKRPNYVKADEFENA